MSIVREIEARRAGARRGGFGAAHRASSRASGAGMPARPHPGRAGSTPPARGAAGVLGAFPEAPRIRREFVDAVSDGPLEERLDQLDRRLEVLGREQPRPVDLLEEAGPRPVTFYLSTAPILGWSPLADMGGRVALRLEPGLAFESDEP